MTTNVIKRSKKTIKKRKDTTHIFALCTKQNGFTSHEQQNTRQNAHRNTISLTLLMFIIIYVAIVFHSNLPDNTHNNRVNALKLIFEWEKKNSEFQRLAKTMRKILCTILVIFWFACTQQSKAKMLMKVLGIFSFT